jgi:hypothetical protein
MSDPLNKFVDEPKRKVPGRKIIQPPGGKGEDFLSSEWQQSADERTLKHCQEERNRSSVFASDEQLPQKTRVTNSPRDQGLGIFTGETTPETARPSTKVLHKPGGETHNIFGVDEDEDDKKPEKKTLRSPDSHDIFGVTGPVEETVTSKTNRLPPGGADHGIFGNSDASSDMERPKTRQPPGGKSSIFGSDEPAKTQSSAEKRSPGGSNTSGIFGGSEVETTRPSSRVLKPPGGGSSNIFG